MYVGIVWSGEGCLNGLKLDCEDELHKEFLVCPNSCIEIVNTSASSELLVFTVFPFKSQ